MRFDLVDLRLFLFVTEAANITHGAARAGMALASASERIRLMEQSLGAPLLERHRRGVRATPAGATLVSHAQLVIQHLERMRGEYGAQLPVRQSSRSGNSCPFADLHHCSAHDLRSGEPPKTKVGGGEGNERGR